MAKKPEVGRLEPTEDNFVAWRGALIDAVEGGKRIHLNTLSLTGKQAALALERRGALQIVEEGNKLVVEKSTSFFRRALQGGEI